MAIKKLHEKQRKFFHAPNKKNVFDQIRSLRGAENIKELAMVELPPLSTTASGIVFLRRHWYGDIGAGLESISNPCNGL